MTQIGCNVTVQYGTSCQKCNGFTTKANGFYFGSSFLCHKCGGIMSANLTQIQWKAREIGHLASSAIGSYEQIGIKAIEDVLQTAVELSNEIDLLAGLQPTNGSQDTPSK